MKSHLNSYQAILSKASHDSETAQKHFERSQQLSHEANRVHSQSATINKNMNEKFTRWLSAQESPLVGDEIGMREAANIIRQNKHGQADLYAQKFMREQMPHETFEMSETSLNRDFNKTNLPSSVNKGVVDHFNNKASSHITHDHQSEADGMKNRLNDGVHKAHKSFETAQSTMHEESKKVEQQYNEDKDKVGLVEAGKKAVRTGGHAVDKIVENEDVLSAANFFMMNHPSMIYQPLGQTESAQNIDDQPIQKIVKIPQVHKGEEPESLDSNKNKSIKIG